MKNFKGTLILPKETRSIFPAVICTPHSAPLLVLRSAFVVSCPVGYLRSAQRIQRRFASKKPIKSLRTPHLSIAGRQRR